MDGFRATPFFLVWKIRLPLIIIWLHWLHANTGLCLNGAFLLFFRQSLGPNCTEISTILPYFYIPSINEGNPLDHLQRNHTIVDPIVFSRIHIQRSPACRNVYSEYWKLKGTIYTTQWIDVISNITQTPCQKNSHLSSRLSAVNTPWTIWLADIRTSVGRTAVGRTALAVQSSLQGGHGIGDFDAFRVVFGKDSSCVECVGSWDWPWFPASVWFPL